MAPCCCGDQPRAPSDDISKSAVLACVAPSQVALLSVPRCLLCASIFRRMFRSAPRVSSALRFCTVSVLRRCSLHVVVIGRNSELHGVSAAQRSDGADRRRGRRRLRRSGDVVQTPHRNPCRQGSAMLVQLIVTLTRTVLMCVLILCVPTTTQQSNTGKLSKLRLDGGGFCSAFTLPHV